jgi:hypothetical protein
MVLSAIYSAGTFSSAVGLWGETPWLSIAEMVRSHAAINVFGFALPGILAWQLTTRTSDSAEMCQPQGRS